MNLTFGDAEETALIPLAVKASETAREKPRIIDKNFNNRLAVFKW